MEKQMAEQKAESERLAEQAAKINQEVQDIAQRPRKNRRDDQSDPAVDGDHLLNGQIKNQHQHMSARHNRRNCQIFQRSIFP